MNSAGQTEYAEESYLGEALELSVPMEDVLVTLDADNPRVSFRCADFLVVYTLDERTGGVGMSLLPADREGREKAAREFLETPEILALPAEILPFKASHGECSLVQLKVAEDHAGGGFGGGRSMRYNPTVEGLRFVKQSVSQDDDTLEIATVLRGAKDFVCRHFLRHVRDEEGVRTWVEFENCGESDLTLEMLSSFCLGALSPFDQADSIERLRVHRFRSSWAAEGRHEATNLEDLHLERSWSSHSVVNERFGQVGSMPVRGFFPFVAIEDVKEEVFWGAQLACASSWQMEIYRRDDKLSISGGLADREFGHWMKRIAPGERFVTPEALVACGVGTLDAFCQRLTRMHTGALADGPSLEEELPIVFNEWCSSWGWPSAASVLKTARHLQDTGVRVFVIDDGWAEKPAGTWQYNGDWELAEDRFPGGFLPVTTALRELGFVPGLWFEFEVCTEGSRAFARDDHKLRRDGRILQVGTRHFWDFTDSWTLEYLAGKVIRRLQQDGFGYLKVDYNETIGVGCDDADSLGEGLRKHIAGVQQFFAALRRAMPGLIVEVCASGGHRSEPSMLALGSMVSFSDSHEGLDIPIIAANLHRLTLPRQSQIWAVLHAEDSLSRLEYSLASCFLGRACLSGKLEDLSPDKFSLVREFMDFYQCVRHLIRDGESMIHREMNASYRHPTGWQAVARLGRPSSAECLVVFHAFGGSEGKMAEAPLPEGPSWELVKSIGTGIGAIHFEPGLLRGRIEKEFSATVVLLRRRLCDLF